MATTTIRCFVNLTNGSATVTLTPGNAGNNGISLAAPNVIEDMLLVVAQPTNATRFVKGSTGINSLELQEPWSGGTLVGAEVRIATSGAAVANLTAAVREVINQHQVADAGLLAATTNAQASADAAAASAVGIGTQLTAAAASAQAASDSAAIATAKAAVATTKAGDAATSATAADTKATVATTKAAESAASAATATTAAGTATTKAGEATASATGAATSATAAATSATTAATASTSATTSAGTATTKAGEATASATGAATSATAAATSATTAATASTSAGTSATAGAASATTATAQATAAGTSATQSAAARDLSIAAWAASTAPTETLAAVSQSAHFGAVVASVIYDTSKDSDGGAWRKRCTGLSWYTETICTGLWRGQRASLAACWAVAGAAAGDYYQSTADGKFYMIGGTIGAQTQAEVFRGNVREFPAQSVVIAEVGRLVIYDAVTSAMWMVFMSTTNGGLLGNYGSPGTPTIAIASACLCVGSNSVYGFLALVNFSGDSAKRYRSNASSNGSEGYWRSGIAARNTTAVWSRNAGLNGFDLGVSLVNETVNAIAITVLPGAPVDPATGLPMPTIAVATAGGVNWLTHSGTVITDTSVGGSASCYNVAFTPDGRLVRNWNDTGYRMGVYNGTPVVPTSSFTAISNYDTYFANGAGGSVPLVPLQAAGFPVTMKSGLASAGLNNGNAGVARFHINPSDRTKTMIAAITNAYNSGWQVGDSRLATLADSTAEVISGSGELIANGTFATDIAGVSLQSNAQGQSISWVGGSLRLKNGPTTGFSTASIPFTTVIGKTYIAQWQKVGGTYPAFIANQIHLGSTLGGTDIASNVPGFGVGGGIASKTFVASSATTWLSPNSDGSNAADYYVDFDNISVKLATPDRSVKNNGLILNGSLTKTAVAAGAGLVAYSGFSAANYLEQPYSANLDFGTGDFYVMGWVKPASIGALQTIVDRSESTSSSPRWRVSVTAVGYVDLTIVSAAVNVSATVTSALSTTAYTHIAVLKRGVTTVEVWVNGTLAASASAASLTTLTNSLANLAIGVNAVDHTTAFSGSLTLIRVGATAPSADQIAHIYRTELPLFQVGAQCTLAGTSTAVTALAFDEDTNTLHAGTSWGRSGFVDLLRVDSEATAVGAITNLSASQGAVLTGGATSARYYQPAFLLRDEIRRKSEARRALGKEPVFFDFDAITAQTAFVVQQGYTVKAVYSAGTLKRVGTTKDYTVSNDGFRETVTFGVAPGNTVWVSVLCVRA